MGWDKNIKLMTLDNVIIGGEEFLITMKEKKELELND